jgi:hypothetical protein
VYRVLPFLLAIVVAACGSVPPVASLPSDAPEARVRPETPLAPASSYVEALQVWHSADDLNAWIGANFEYDTSRAVVLSETRRPKSTRIPIPEPRDFFTAPRGVCVDLTRFAVETLRVIDPGSRPAYLVIEFAPISVAGNTFRLHWLAMFRRGEGFYFFADSKRPGYVAGPYLSIDRFIDEYAQYRRREVVSYRALDSYERRMRSRATRQSAKDAGQAR